MREDLINLKLLIDDDTVASSHQCLATYREMLSATIHCMLEYHADHTLEQKRDNLNLDKK